MVPLREVNNFTKRPFLGRAFHPPETCTGCRCISRGGNHAVRIFHRTRRPVLSVVFRQRRRPECQKSCDTAAQHKETLAYSLQTVSVKANCFPPQLRGILSYIAAKTGRRPIVTSGFRARGRAHSQHRHCAAADIRVPGVSDRTIVAIAASAPGIGGIGRYCNGIVHVDIGPKRKWTYC